MHRYIPVLAKWAGYGKIGEKEVEHRPRKYGSSKFGWERFINGFLDLTTIMFIGKFGKKPHAILWPIGYCILHDWIPDQPLSDHFKTHQP